MPNQEHQRYVLKQGYFPDGDPQPAAKTQPIRRSAAKSQRRPIPIRLVALILAVVVVIGAGVILLPRLFTGSAPASWSGADLAGSWATASTDGASFAATVAADAITVNWNTDGAQALYWSGSFPVPAGSEQTKTVISAASAANQTSLMASSDPQKTFTVTRDSIQFDASMLGVTRRFTLRRQ